VRSVVRVAFSRKNIFRAIDEPAYLYVDTEGRTVRLKVYEQIEETTAIYLDDTATGTDRTGVFEVQLWSTNPHGPPSTTWWYLYDVVVEVYDTENRLIERRLLGYAYTSYSPKTVEFRDERGNYVTGAVAYDVVIDGKVYYILDHGAKLTFPAPPPEYETRGYLEFTSFNPKFYYVDRLDRILRAIGGATGLAVTVRPMDSVTVAMEYDLSALNALVDVPIIGEFIKFILWLGVNAVNYGLVIGEWFLKRLGISGWMPVGCELVSTSPVVIRVYYETDVSPLVVALILGIIAGTVLLALFIRDMYVKGKEYEYRALLAEVQRQYYEIVSKAWEYARTQPSPSETFTKVVSQIPTPQTNVSNAKEETDSLTKTIEQLKAIVVLVIVAAIVVTALRLVR
jgi:hypothetical protein